MKHNKLKNVVMFFRSVYPKLISKFHIHYMLLFSNRLAYPMQYILSRIG